MGNVDRRSFLAAGVVSAGALFAARRASTAAATPEAERYWPQWRGPLGTGEGPLARPPLEWGEGRNVRWKVELPGEGKSTPLVWRDLLVLTAAVPAQPRKTPSSAAPDASAVHEFVVLALSRSDGQQRWSRTVRKELPHEGTHEDGSFAAGSAVTDGQRIYAFLGSRGLYALDMAGQLLWEAQLGRMRTKNAFGEGASPALYRGTLIVNWDHDGGDFIAAFDARTGKELWRTTRDEPTTWATPLVVEEGGRAQAVVSGSNAVRSYDVATGELVWEAPGLTANVIPSPVYADGIVHAMSGFRGNALRSVRVSEAKGLLSGPPGLVWSYDRDTPYVPSPALYRGGLYFLKSNSGVLTCLDSKTGALHYTERLDPLPNVYASPVAADGRIYVVGREGGAVVLEAGHRLKRLATNHLDDGFDASPAIVDGEMYLRGRRHLYRISTS